MQRELRFFQKLEQDARLSPNSLSHLAHHKVNPTAGGTTALVCTGKGFQGVMIFSDYSS